MKPTHVGRTGFFTALWSEIKKFPPYFAFKAKENVKLVVEGDEAYRKKTEIMETIRATRNAEHEEKKREALKGKSFVERFWFNMKNLKEAVKEASSVQAGQKVLLQHCIDAHTAAVAMENNIDVKSVNMTFQTRKKSDGIGHETVVVGYIDAPSASKEEVAVFAHALHKACPVANRMSVEWQQGENLSDANTAPVDEAAASSVPRGTPGYMRHSRRSGSAEHSRWTAGHAEGETFTLPGVPSKQKDQDKD